MLGLFKSKKERPPLEGPPSIGENRRVYAVGDIHGRIDLLMDLMELIGRDDWRRKHKGETSLVLLGDYVDRGPHSREVIDYILKLKEQWRDMTCLMGNHEQVFLMAINGDEQAIRFFVKDGVGGRQTLMSYGVTSDEIDALDASALWERIATVVPQAHKDFLAGLYSQSIIGDYAFVHAGIQPGVPMAEQEETDLYWIRDPFLNHESAHPYMIVHGHSIREDVEQRSNRIGIDTGAYASGRLTAVGLEGTECWFLSTGER
ncbi:MAG: serine/threonine protein phosphatase [Sphingobium sp.]|nr:serine/threonine protein phosphatase [Sphingobium sp.]